MVVIVCRSYLCEGRTVDIMAAIVCLNKVCEG